MYAVIFRAKTNELDQEIGVYHYNKGLHDAQDIFKSRVESVMDAIYELEVTTEFSGK